MYFNPIFSSGDIALEAGHHGLEELGPFPHPPTDRGSLSSSAFTPVAPPSMMSATMRNQGPVIDQEDDLLRSNFLPVINSESIHDPTITLSGSSTLSMLTSGIVCTYSTLLYILTLKSLLKINNNNNNNFSFYYRY